MAPAPQSAPAADPLAAKPLAVRVRDLQTDQFFNGALVARDGVRCLLRTDALLPLKSAIQVNLPGEIWLAEVIGRTPAGQEPAIIAEVCHTLKRDAR